MAQAETYAARGIEKVKKAPFATAFRSQIARGDRR